MNRWAPGSVGLPGTGERLHSAWGFSGTTVCEARGFVPLSQTPKYPRPLPKSEIGSWEASVPPRPAPDPDRPRSPLPGRVFPPPQSRCLLSPAGPNPRTGPDLCWPRHLPPRTTRAPQALPSDGWSPTPSRPRPSPPGPARAALGALCRFSSVPRPLAANNPPRSPGVSRSLPRSPLVSQLLTVPPILSDPLVPSVPSVPPVPWPGMARATEPERRLLAIYTGGTIGMRSERGGESATAPEGAASGVGVGGMGWSGCCPAFQRPSAPHRPPTPSPGHRRACSWTEERRMGLDLSGVVSSQRAQAVCGWQLSGPAPGTVGVGSRGLPEHVCPLTWPNKAVGRCLGAASPLTRTTGQASVMGLHTHLF